MEEADDGVKTKTLAVFENVVTKGKQKRHKKFRPNRFTDDDSSPSECDLVIDDEVKDEPRKRKRSTKLISYNEEPLNVTCLWDDCLETFSNEELFYKHLVNHINDNTDYLSCKWMSCPAPDNIDSYETLKKHVVYHGYISKLTNIGDNVAARHNLPECKITPSSTLEISSGQNVCEWDGCLHNCLTLPDFFSHVKCHALGVPSGRSRKVSAPILCKWDLCNAKLNTRWRLVEHLKVHTGERMVACPTCYALFSNRSTFSDHRRRQLNSEMRSYQCSQCLKLFSSEKILSDHMRSHINQYKCSMCDMTKPKPSMLAKHFRYKHMNIRQFVCQVCQKTFVTKWNLNTHLLTHQSKPFQCDQCEFACKSKVGLTNHLKKVHGKEGNQYECQICKKMYVRGEYLTKHLMKSHKFHWPSGHSRFRYRKDSDGIYRLQTVRYESLEVTEEMMKSESMKPTAKTTGSTYSVIREDRNKFKLELQEPEESEVVQVNEIEGVNERKVDSREVLVTIEDVDEEGCVLKSEEIEISEIVLI